MADRSLQGCFLDTGTLGDAVDWTPLTQTLDHWQWHHHTATPQVAGRICNADVVITNKVIINAEAMAAAPHLRLICIAATGTNNVDLQAAAERGIIVANVRDYAQPAVAQHVLALMLAHTTQWQHYAAAVDRGDWSHSPFFCLLDYPIEELAGATLGIIGYGTLGQAVAKRARAFDMRILIAERAQAQRVRDGRTELAQVLAESDYISLHCPLTESTHHLIDHNALAAMKSTAYLINTARGPIIDETALAAALHAGEIAGAAVDVLSAEPPPPDHPLLAGNIPGLIITPHCAWASRGARQRMLDTLAANIRAFLRGQPCNQVA